MRKKIVIRGLEYSYGYFKPSDYGLMVSRSIRGDWLKSHEFNPSIVEVGFSVVEKPCSYMSNRGSVRTVLKTLMNEIITLCYENGKEVIIFSGEDDRRCKLYLHLLKRIGIGTYHVIEDIEYFSIGIGDFMSSKWYIGE